MRYAYILWLEQPPRVRSFHTYDAPPQDIKLVDGKPVLVPVIEEERPEFDAETHRLVTHTDITAESWHRHYEAVQLTEAELVERINQQAQTADETIPAAAVKALLREQVIEPDDSSAGLWPAWKVPVDYPADYIFQWQDVLYRTLVALTSQAHFPPHTTITQYVRVSAPGDDPLPWEPDSNYGLDAEVTHADKTWRSRRDANVWEPGTSGGGWMQIAPEPLLWVHVGPEGYPAEWELWHNDMHYRNVFGDGNHWTPGEFGWEVLP
jgi:hypothetical protein